MVAPLLRVFVRRGAVLIVASRVREFLVPGLLLIGVMALAGCAGPPPRLFPPWVARTGPHPGGGEVRWYDADSDGRRDYREQVSPDGRLVALDYDRDGDGRLDEHVDLRRIAPEACRELVLILDSVPFSLVEAAWQEGRFRFCGPPSRVISPFPVMTDVSLAEFFGTAPPPGVESAYYDGQRLSSGYRVYADRGNMTWIPYVDYHLTPVAHSLAYLDPRPWYLRELRRIREEFERSGKQVFIGYVVGTSALGAQFGRDGHKQALLDLDRFCRRVLYEERGRVRFTLMSDHGHHMTPSRRIPLSDILGGLGYHPTLALKAAGDVVVPEFGMVSYAAVYTQDPARVAADLMRVDGVDLAAWCPSSENIVVLSRRGRATIRRSSQGFLYTPEVGDPLLLLPILDDLARRGRIDADGGAPDEILFRATAHHIYPDGVGRLWRAFHGLVEHTPDVFVSTENGTFCGSGTMSRFVSMIGVHGSLKPMSSTGFAMTTAGELPPVLRMSELRPALGRLGVDIPGADFNGG